MGDEKPELFGRLETSVLLLKTFLSIINRDRVNPIASNAQSYAHNASHLTTSAQLELQLFKTFGCKEVAA